VTVNSRDERAGASERGKGFAVSGTSLSAVTSPVVTFPAVVIDRRKHPTG
jgi:hypothetical protein